MNAIDSIPNPHNAPTIYEIVCKKINRDTIIELIATPIFIREVNSNNTITNEIKGACNINNKMVVVIYDDFDSLKNIINEDILSLEYYEKNYLFVDNIKPFYIYTYEYKLINADSLVLLYKQKKQV
jgi:predicted transcriptional regulator